MHRTPFSACIYGGPEVDRMVFSRTVMEQVSNLSMYVYVHAQCAVAMSADSVFCHA